MNTLGRGEIIQAEISRQTLALGKLETQKAQDLYAIREKKQREIYITELTKILNNKPTINIEDLERSIPNGFKIILGDTLDKRLVSSKTDRDSNLAQGQIAQYLLADEAGDLLWLDEFPGSHVALAEMYDELNTIPGEVRNKCVLINISVAAIDKRNDDTTKHRRALGDILKGTMLSLRNYGYTYFFIYNLAACHQFFSWLEVGSLIEQFLSVGVKIVAGGIYSEYAVKLLDNPIYGSDEFVFSRPILRIVDLKNTPPKIANAAEYIKTYLVGELYYNCYYMRTLLFDCTDPRRSDFDIFEYAKPYILFGESPDFSVPPKSLYKIVDILMLKIILADIKDPSIKDSIANRLDRELDRISELFNEDYNVGSRDEFSKIKRLDPDSELINDLLDIGIFAPIYFKDGTAVQRVKIRLPEIWNYYAGMFKSLYLNAAR